MDKNETFHSAYQRLFDFFCEEHNLILTVQEMDEIIRECAAAVVAMD